MAESIATASDSPDFDHANERDHDAGHVYSGIVPPGLELVSITPFHPNRDYSISPWLDEQIWGHRLWDAESPWLVFLEFLGVAESLCREDRLFEGDQAGRIIFRPRQRMYLRNILFHSDDALRYAEREVDSESAWAMWLARIGDRAQGVSNRDFSYLKARFHNFSEFAHVLRLVRGAVVDPGSNKRWSSRFVFPFGKHALYEDVHVNDKTNKAVREYINFGRTGELLYMMMNRSMRRESVRPFVRHMVNTDNRWDRLVGLLQPIDDEDHQARGPSFLPYSSHPVFDQLTDDWIAIGKLDLPGFDSYPHCVTLAGFHLWRYQLAISSVWARSREFDSESESDSDANLGRVPNQSPYCICEIVAPMRTPIRRQALASFARNDTLSARAVEEFIRSIAESHGWKEAKSGAGAFLRCKQYLQRLVFWGEDYEGPNDPDALLKSLRVIALRRHAGHLGQFHRVMGREIGLVSKRGTNRFRYAPTDLFVRTLLFANVEQRMELNEFLAVLFARYGIVIGAREAEKVLPSEEYDNKAFQANAQRLEQRLESLGLLKRLSDACAYVVNPYTTTSGQRVAVVDAGSRA